MVSAKRKATAKAKLQSKATLRMQAQNKLDQTSRQMYSELLRQSPHLTYSEMGEICGLSGVRVSQILTQMRREEGEAV